MLVVLVVALWSTHRSMTSFPSTNRRTPSSAVTVNAYVPAAQDITRVHRATKWSLATPAAGDASAQLWSIALSCRETTGAPVGIAGAVPAPGVFQYSANHGDGWSDVVSQVNLAMASQPAS